MATQNFQKLYDLLKRKGAQGIGNNADDLQRWASENPENITTIYNGLKTLGVGEIGNNPEELGNWLNYGSAKGGPQSSSSAATQQDPLKTPSTVATAQVTNTDTTGQIAQGVGVGSVIGNAVYNAHQQDLQRIQQRMDQPESNEDQRKRFNSRMEELGQSNNVVDSGDGSYYERKEFQRRDLDLFQDPKMKQFHEDQLALQSSVDSIVGENFDTLWNAAEEKSKSDAVQMNKEIKQRNKYDGFLSSLGRAASDYNGMLPEGNNHTEDYIKGLKSTAVNYSPTKMTEQLYKNLPEEVLQQAYDSRLKMLGHEPDADEEAELNLQAANDLANIIYQGVITRGGEKWKQEQGDVGMFLQTMVEATLLPQFYRMRAKGELRLEENSKAIKDIPEGDTDALNGLRSIAMSKARKDMAVDGLDPMLQAQAMWSEEHPVISAVATGAGMVADPAMAAGMGAAKVTTMGTRWLLGKTVSKAAPSVGARILEMTGSKMYKVGTGMIGGGMNFATFEGLHDVVNQMEDVKGDFSVGDVFKTAGHGFLTGAAAGTIGGLVGAGTEAAAARAQSNSSRILTRIAGNVAGFEGEALAFSLGDILDPDADGWDAFMKNQGMVLGFKMFGAAKHGLTNGFARSDSRTYKPMFQQMYERMAAPGEHGLRPDEIQQLRELGYQDVADEMRDSKAVANFISHMGENVPQATEGEDQAQQKTVTRLQEFMANSKVPMAIRQKIGWIATGQSGPMPPVAQTRTDGNTVTTYDYNGQVIEQRTFENENQRDWFLKKARHQAELGLTELAEASRENIIYQSQVSEIANDIARNKGYESIDQLRAGAMAESRIAKLKQDNGQEVTPEDMSMTTILQDVINEAKKTYADSNKSTKEDGNHPDHIRERLNKQFGVNIDKALAKDHSKRSKNEKKAISEYLKFLDEEIENSYGMGVYNKSIYAATKQARQMGKSASAVDEIDTLWNSYDVAYEDFCDAFGESPSEYFSSLSIDELTPSQKLNIMRDLGVPEEKIAIAERYFVTWSARLGLGEQVENCAIKAADKRKEELRPTIHDDGNRYQIQLKDGRTVFIVDGDVKTEEDQDGRVVLYLTDFTIYDPRTGEHEIKSKEDVENYSQPLDGEVFLEEQAEMARRKEKDLLLERLNRGFNITKGTKVHLKLDGENFEECTIQARNPETGDILVELPDGDMKELPQEDIMLHHNEWRKNYYRRTHNLEKKDWNVPAENVEQQRNQPEQGRNITTGGEAPAEVQPVPSAEPRVSDGSIPEYKRGKFVGIDENGREREGIISGVDDTGRVNWFWWDDYLKYLEDKDHKWLQDDTPEDFHKRVKSWEPDPEEAKAEQSTEEIKAEAPTEEARPENPKVVSEQPTEPAAQEVTPEPAASQPNKETIPTRQVGRKTVTDYTAVPPERTHENIFNEMDLDEEEATDFVNGKISSVTKAIENNTKKKPKASDYGEISEYKEAKRKWSEENDRLQAEQEHWQKVLDIHNNKPTEEVKTEEAPKAEEPIAEEAKAAPEEVKTEEPVAEAPKEEVKEAAPKPEETPKEEAPKEEVKETPTAEATKEETPAEESKPAPEEVKAEESKKEPSYDDPELKQLEESAYKKELQEEESVVTLDALRQNEQEFLQENNLELAAYTRGRIRALEEKAQKKAEAPKEKTPKVEQQSTEEVKPTEEGKAEAPKEEPEETGFRPKTPEELEADRKMEEEARLQRVEESAYENELKTQGGEDKLSMYQNLLSSYERKGDKEMAAKTRGKIRAIEEKAEKKHSVLPNEEKKDGRKQKGGFIHNEHSKKVSRKTADLLDAVSRPLGLSVRFGTKEEADGANAFIQGKDITINKDLLDITDNEERTNAIIATVFGHEVTHHLKDSTADAPEVWNAFVNAVRDVMGKDEFQRWKDDLRRNYDEFYKGKGYRRLSDAEIEEEIAVEQAGRRLMTDQDFMRRVLDKVAENNGDAKGLVKRIKETLQGLINRLRKAFGLHPNAQQRDALQALEDMKALWDGMYEYAAAKEHEREYEQALPKETIMEKELTDRVGSEIGMETGLDETPRKHSTIGNIEGCGFIPVKGDNKGNVAFEDEEGNRFSIERPVTVKDLKERKNSALKFLLNDLLAKGVATPQDVDLAYDVMAKMLNYYAYIGSAEKGGFDNLSKQHLWIGETIYKSLSPNNDKQYSKSVDIIRVCKKNEAVIRSISEMQTKVGYGITGGQVMDIFKQTVIEGYQAPCSVCYVFNRYVQNGQYTTCIMNGYHKYSHMLVDPRKLSAKEKEEHLKFWIAEHDKAVKAEEDNAAIIKQAKQDLNILLYEIDKLSTKYTDPNISPEEMAQVEKRVQYLDKRYRAALDVVAQNSLASWIKCFAIKPKGEGWTLRNDSWRLPKPEIVLDLRRSAEAIRRFVAVQRFRMTRGAAAGKAISFESNNDIGDIALGLGLGEGALRKFESAKKGTEDIELTDNPNDEQNYRYGVENLYRMAAKEQDPKKRAKLLRGASRKLDQSILFIKRQTLRGGQRMWSWSDNVETLAPDITTSFLQLAMMKSAVQTYSKQLEGIHHVATLKGYVNGSLIATGNGYREVSEDQLVKEGDKYYLKDGDKVFQPTAGKFAGKKITYRTPAYYDEKTEKWYVAEFDSTIGIDPYGEVSEKDGKYRRGLFALNQELDRAGNIMVGMNDIHVRMMMADDRIFFIIPWHSSGANSHLLQQMYSYLGVVFDPKQAQDYTHVQDDKFKKETDEIDDFLTKLWEQTWGNKREIKGYGKISGQDFKCGIEGGVESGNGKLSESQILYRQIRNAILYGLEDGKVRLEESHPEWVPIIEADEFLSQLYHKMIDTFGESGMMTKDDCNHIYPYEYWDKKSTYETADINGLRYLEYCRRLGVLPKFVGGEGKKYGDFHLNRGYWKVLIDRRMYDLKGNYQDLDPVDISGFHPDLIDPEKTKEEFKVTRVADKEGVTKIVGKVMERGKNRPGGLPEVNYNLTMDEAARVYEEAVNADKNMDKELNEAHSGDEMDDEVLEQDSEESESTPKKKRSSKKSTKKHSIIGIRGAENLDVSEGKKERVNNRETAIRMEKEGRHPEDIRMATGWQKGKDGNWRYETDHYPDPTDFVQSHAEDFQKAKEAAEALGDKRLTMDDIKGAAAKFKLSEVIPEDDEIFSAYPEFKDVDVYFDFKMYDGGGWNPKENRMILSIGDAYQKGDTKEIRDSLIHELQHAIQRKEGFTPGSSMKRAEEYIDRRREELNQQRQDIRDLFHKGLISREVAEEQLQPVLAGLRDLHNDYGVYRRQAGEVEARNAAARASMSLEERRNSSLEDTEDVPRIEQLLYGEGSDDPQQFIGKKAREAYEKLLADKRPELSRRMRNKALDYLHSLADTKENTKRIKSAVNWLAKGSVRLPDDMFKIDQALSVAEKAKVDPMQYESPQALMDAHIDIKPTSPRINPDEVPTLTNRTEMGDGVVVYDVDESEKSRENMRAIIDTHWGEDANPWCLLARTEKDKSKSGIKKSRTLWDRYSGNKKRVAFKDGKLLAFQGSETERDVWWDRQDKPAANIRYTKKRTTKDGEKCNAVYEVGKDKLLYSFTGEKKNGPYKEWDSNDEISYDVTFDEKGRLTGSFQRHGEYLLGTYRGQEMRENGYAAKNIEKVETIPAVEYSNYKDGQLKGPRVIVDKETGNIITYQEWDDGCLSGLHVDYHKDGTLKYVERYEGGRPSGKRARYDEDGTITFAREKTGRNLDSGYTYFTGELTDKERGLKITYNKSVEPQEVLSLNRSVGTFDENGKFIPAEGWDKPNLIEHVNEMVNWLHECEDLKNSIPADGHDLVKERAADMLPKLPQRKHSLIGYLGAMRLDDAEKRAKTNEKDRRESFRMAEEMERDAKDAKAIWAVTGWERGKDGNWRYEIPDSNIGKIIEDKFGPEKIQYMKDFREKYFRWQKSKDVKERMALELELGSMLDDMRKNSRKSLKLTSFLGKDHPLFKAYPYLENYKVTFNFAQTTDQGWHDRSRNVINLNPLYADMDISFMHELQHVIQWQEDFAYGSSQQKARNYIIERRNEIKREIKGMQSDLWDGKISQEDYRKRMESYTNEEKELKDSFDIYKREAGEVEARNAETRYGMTEEERAQTPPSETEDTPRDRQLVYSRRHSLIGVKGAQAMDAAEGSTKRMDALEVAKEKIKGHEDDIVFEEKIWKDTGWGKGWDGQWRYEIPDANLDKPISKWFGKERVEELNYLEEEKRKKAKEQMSYRAKGDLEGEIAKYREGAVFSKRFDKLRDRSIKITTFLGKSNPIFTAYPELRDISVVFEYDPNKPNQYGEYNPSAKLIRLNAYRHSIMDKAFMHELQHAIQGIEDFTSGANVEYAKNHIEKRKPEINKEIDDLDRQHKAGKISDEDYDEKLEELEDELDRLKDPYQVYRKQAGEVEARNAETRYKMSPEERKNQVPEWTEDTYRWDQHDITGRTSEGGRRHSIIMENQDYQEELAKQKKVSFRELDPNDEFEKDIIRQLHTEGEYITVYRTMQIIDGKLYSPMAADIKSRGKVVSTPEIKLWAPEAAEEHPELVYLDENGEAKIKISKKSTESTDLDVAYNPYIHTSYGVLNDQFTAAWNRPNLVVVECRVPKSELTSGYKADVIQNGKKVGTAKDAVGELDWHSGPVSSQLRDKGDPRRVVLSRYDMPVRVLSNREVAQKIHEQIKDHSDINLPWNLFHPEVKAEMEKMGHKFNPEASGLKKNFNFDKARKWTEKNVNPVANEDVERINREHLEMADRTPEGKSRALNAMADHLKVPVTVLNSDEDIRNTSLFKRTKDEKERQRMLNSKGWFDHQTGEIVINMGKHDTAGDVAETILHEAVGHKGFREIFGEEGNTQLWNEVYDNLADDVRDRVNQLAGKYGYRDFAEATEEYAANLAQKGFKDFDHQEYKFWKTIRKKVVNAINKIFEKLNIRLGKDKLNINDNELRQLLWNSYDHLVKGDLLQRAEDLARRQDILDEEAKTDASYRDGDDPIWGEQSQLTLKDRMLAETLRQSQLHQTDRRMRQRAVDDVIDNLKDLVRDMRNRQGRARSFQGADQRVETQVGKAAKAVEKNDVQTADRMKTLVRILNSNGYLQNLGKQDLNNLMKALSDSVGKDDVKAEVDRVLDVVTKNLLSRANEAFGKALTLGGTRVNSKGVDALKELDPRGVVMMEALSKGMKYDETTLNQLIQNAQNDMGHPDPAKAEDAADRFAGLTLAHEWLTNVKQLQMDELQLRDQIAIAEDEYRAGRISKDQRDQMVQAYKDAIRDNHLQRISNLEELTGRIYDEAMPSAQRAIQWRQQEKQRIEEIHHNANSDLQGVANEAQRKDSRVQRFMSSSATQFFLKPLCTFEQMLRQFGSKSVNGEGYLYDRFMRGWVDANQTEYVGYTDACTKLNRKSAELFGQTHGLRKRDVRFADINSIIKNLPKMTASITDEGKPREIELDQGQLLYLWMIDKMSDGRMKLRAMGIGEDQIRAIDNFLDPRLKEMGDWLQEDFLPELRRKYNQTHRKVFGANMASIDAYFPLKIQKNALTREVQATDPDNEPPLGTAVTGAIKRRKVNTQPIDIINCNAFDVMADHVREMEHWNAFAQWDRDMTDLLSYKTFRNKVMNMTTVYGGGKQLFDSFRHCAQMASGSYQPTKGAVDKGIVQMGKMVTMAKISGRMYTAFKQLMSFPAYFSDASAWSLTKNAANAKGSWIWCKENLPMFRKRWESRMVGETRLKTSEDDYNNSFTRMVETLGKWGMSPNAAVDALTVAIGARSIYETKFKQYKRENFSDEDAHKLAIQDAETAYNLTQQSSEGAFTSTIQVDRTAAAVALSVFRNASMAYQRQLFDAYRNLSHMVTPGYKRESLEFMAKKLERQGLNRQDAEAAAKMRYRRQLTHDLVRVGLNGFILQFTWNLASYLPYLLCGDDDQKKKEMLADAARHAALGAQFEGLTGGNIGSEALNMLGKGESLSNYDPTMLPMMADMKNLVKKLGSDKVAAFTDLINLAAQIPLGMNPDTGANITVGIIDLCWDVLDACKGDPEAAHEAMMAVMQILNCPTSQIDEVYFDAIGRGGRTAQNMTPKQIAERYAIEKVKRGARWTSWVYDDFEEGKALQKKRKRANEKMKERLFGVDPEADELINDHLDQFNREKDKIEYLKALLKYDPEEAKRVHQQLKDDGTIQHYETFKALNTMLEAKAKAWLEAPTPEKADELALEIFEIRQKIAKKLRELDKK